MPTPVVTEDRAGCFSIWDQPQDGVEYVAGIDAAENKKRDRSANDRRRAVSYSDTRPDYSAVVVLEMETGLHVATWHGYCPPDELSAISAAIGYYYNTALLVPEINGPGLAVVTRLAETIRYDNLYRTRMFNVLDRDPWSPQYGWQTNASSRKILMTRVHEALNSNQLFTRDADLIRELRTMEFDDQGTERARGKNKDDRVLAFSMALQGRHESVGGTVKKVVVKRKPEERYADAVWDHVEKKIHANRTSSSPRLFAPWSRDRLPGR